MIVGPEEGSQACGEQGFGRVSEVENIISALRLYDVNRLLLGQRILITAGPTHEAIDPVRYISNRSSGKMGYALAQAALMAGAEVTLISGPSALAPPAGVAFHRVNSAHNMFNAVMEHLQPGMIFMGAAAVADYQIATPALEKLKKHKNATLTLSLTANPDILATVAASGKSAFVVGFAAETTNVIKHATEKLHAKKLDMIIANQVGYDLGFDHDDNQVTIITKHKQIELPLTHKTRLAGQIIAILAATLQNDG
jgi:phosphopantothenoylcysteine decarboxylase/phosphopantothenate--cysteine ligase